MSNLSEEKPKTETPPKPVETPKPAPKPTPEPKHEPIEGIAPTGGPKFPKPPEKPEKRAYHKRKKPVKKDRPYYHDLLGIDD